MQPNDTPDSDDATRATQRAELPSERLMPCPQCGHPMPDLRGGKASICANCGYKESCCF